MKTILVPTDFSDTSINAIEYAVEMAKITSSKIILLHVYHMPISTTEAITVLPMDIIEKDCMDALEKLQADLLAKNYGLQIESVCKCGFALDEISEYGEKNNVDLIVMGMQGAGNISEKVMGSITTALIRKTKRPVLAIADNIKFKVVGKIVLGCDYLTNKNKTLLEPLKEVANLFGAHIFVLKRYKTFRKST